MGKQLHLAVCAFLAVWGRRWLEMSDFTPLPLEQAWCWRHRGRSWGEAGRRPQLGADQPVAGSRVSDGPCLLLIAQISANESQHVQASRAEKTHRGQRSEKSFQRKTETSGRWKTGKLMKTFRGEVEGKVGKEPSFWAQSKRLPQKDALERQKCCESALLCPKSVDKHL